jgi:hypothetical protein
MGSTVIGRRSFPDSRSHLKEIAMASAGWDLQKAVYAALSSDLTLTTLLGGANIHDAAPRDAAFPYVVIDQMQMRDWSTGTEAGTEHMLTLHVWSDYAGKREACDIADGIRTVLDGAMLPLEDHRLINLRHQYSELKRDEDGQTHHGVLRFRAVTEPLS